MAAPLRLDLRDRLPVRFRARAHQGAGDEGAPRLRKCWTLLPEWLQDWGKQTGAKLEDGLRESPSWIAFARENGTVYHTYTVSAPDPFVAPYYSFLLERTPKATDESEPRAWRKDEYPESIGAPR